MHVIEKDAKNAVSVNVTEKGAWDPSDYEKSQHLSFFQRHFYRTYSAPEDDENDPPRRHFSFLSPGSIFCLAALTLMVIAAVLCAVLSTVLQQHRREASLEHSPVKQAIFANFPDPAIIEHNGTWYAFATNNAAGILKAPADSPAHAFGSSNVQIAISQNYVNWTLLESSHDPLPKLGAWVTKNMTKTSPSVTVANVWAPEILKRADGNYVLYYAALAADNTTHGHCVGAAVSTLGPAGPYDPLDTAIACPIELGGAIDPVSFVDIDETVYLAWKVDGNNAGHGGICGNTVPPLVNTPIMLLKMEADGTTSAGEAITIMNREKSDGPLVEAPSIVRSDEGLYFLFFSSGCTRDPSYDVKYAWAHNVTGPYTRAAEPLLRTGDFGLLAPGSIGVRRNANGTIEMAFHARVATDYGKVRAMYTSSLEIDGTKVTLRR